MLLMPQIKPRAGLCLRDDTRTSEGYWVVVVVLYTMPPWYAHAGSV